MIVRPFYLLPEKLLCLIIPAKIEIDPGKTLKGIRIVFLLIVKGEKDVFSFLEPVQFEVNKTEDLPGLGIVRVVFKRA